MTAVVVVDTNVCGDCCGLDDCDELATPAAACVVGGGGELVVVVGGGLVVVVVGVVVGAYGCELMFGRMAVERELVNGVVVSLGLAVEASEDETRSTKGDEFAC